MLKNYAEKNAEMAAEQNAMQQVCLALKTHLQSPEVVEAVTAAMVSLSLDGENVGVMV